MSWLRVGSAGDSPALFQRAFAADEDCVEAHYGVGLVALACGDLPTAQKAFARVLALDAGQANAAYHLGLVAEARGNLGEATRFYRRALSLGLGLEQATRRLPPRSGHAAAGST